MIKIESDRGEKTIELKGSLLELMCEFNSIIKKLGEEENGKQLLDTMFIELVNIFTKEEMINKIDRAMKSREFGDKLKNMAINDALKEVMKKAEALGGKDE